MMHRKLQPSGDHILIQYADGARAQTASAKIAARPKGKKSAAKVIAVGPGREAADGSVTPLGLKVGQRVFVKRACGIKIRLNRQSYAVIRKRDLVAARA
jgi:chaperonin GroES